MIKKTVIFVIVFLFAIQFISVDKSAPKIDEKLTLKAPTEVMDILKTSCYDCHSFETKWPTYSSIAPISFFVSSHVKKGRNAMNFSKWNVIDDEIKAQRLKRAIKTVNNSLMALPSYVSIHEEAKLNKEQKDILTTWFKSELDKLNNK